MQHRLKAMKVRFVCGCGKTVNEVIEEQYTFTACDMCSVLYLLDYDSELPAVYRYWKEMEVIDAANCHSKTFSRVLEIVLGFICSAVGVTSLVGLLYLLVGCGAAVPLCPATDIVVVNTLGVPTRIPAGTLDDPDKFWTVEEFKEMIIQRGNDYGRR